MSFSDLPLKLLSAVVFASIICGQDASKRIGEIEFYGYAGIDLNKVRSSLPIREGDPFAGIEELRLEQMIAAGEIESDHRLA